MKTTDKKIMRSKQWFLDRISKKVFRNDDGCSCGTCADVVKNGIVIHDEQHATYMYDTQNDWMAEGIVLNYRDKL